MKQLNLDRYTSSLSQDVLLSKRVLNGERELFELLLRPYDEMVQKAIAIILNDPELTQRVVLRTYLISLKTLYRFYGQASFPAWLLGIGMAEARKHKKPLHAAPQITLTETQWLSLIIKKVCRFGKKDIAFCLSISEREAGLNLKIAAGLARQSALILPIEARGHDYRYNNLIKHIARLFLSAGENESDISVRNEMNSIVTALFEENKEHETRIPMDLEKEHRDNLMLCAYIRLGFLKGVEMHRIRNYTDWYWQNHLLAHFKHEEAIVFPLLGKKHDLVKKALAQHRRLKRLFESKDDIHKMLSRIEDELLAHVRFEEKVLFKEIERNDNRNVLSTIGSLHHEPEVANPWPDQFWK